jgi:cytochrome c peroxidase
VVEKPGAEILPMNDPGRYQVTKTATDQYVFKVPTLRNIALTPPYFHTGKVWDLQQAVAVMGRSQLGATPLLRRRLRRQRPADRWSSAGSHRRR